MGECVAERLTTENYQNLSGRFMEEKNDFTKQYSNIYNARLSKMRCLLQEAVKKKWQVEYPIFELHKLPEDDTKCIIIGTLFKDQKLKPSILKQLAESNSLVPQPVHLHFTDESDSLHIADELQRVQLLGNLKKSDLVTGITCALLGINYGNGKFTVEDYCFAGYREQVKRPLPLQDKFVVFVSGLNLINIQDVLLPLRILVNWISGVLGNINEIDVKNIVRLVIAGNSTRIASVKHMQTTSLTSRTIETPEVIESVKMLDNFLNELGQILPIDVMPGEHDPSNHMLPQMAMHHCMFPKSIKYQSVNLVSNPYNCIIDDLNFLGSSGQPIKNVLNFSDLPEGIDVLESCLKWNHIAPTAPDTLGCYPFYKNDPFIIETCPHVMFAGNQAKFDTKISEGDDGQKVRLICIPEFVSTGTVVVLNLKSLDCVPIKFNIF